MASHRAPILLVALCMCLSGILLVSCEERTLGPEYYRNPVYGNGIMDTLLVTTEPFQRIYAAGWADITVTQADTFSVMVIIDENIVRYISPGARDSVFHIRVASMAEYQPSSARVYITMPELKGVELDYYAEVTAVGSFQHSGKFDASLKWNSEFEGEHFQCDSLEIELMSKCNFSGGFDVAGTTIIKANGGDVQLSGSSGNTTIFARDDCDLDLEEYKSTNVTLDANGESRVSLWVTGLFTVAVYENAKVYYRGNPSTIYKDVWDNGILEPI